MQRAPDFIIRRGTLLAYTGSAAVVRVPAGVKGIGSLAFADNDTLEEVLLPKGLRGIEDAAFLNCTALRAVTLPESLWSIGASAFAGCEALRDISLPAGLGNIGEAAFWGCRALERIALPDGIPFIPARLFQFCSSLRELTLPPTLRAVDDFAFGDTALRDVTFPSGLVLLGEGVFTSCKALRSLTLPDTLEEIGNDAFSLCTGLKALTIPAAVEELGTFVFAGCESLRELRLAGDACRLRADVFGYRLPEPLYGVLEALWPRMTDGAVKQYLLNERGWAALSPDARNGVFAAHHGKALLPAYSAVTGLSVEKLIEIRKEKAPLETASAADPADERILKEICSGKFYKYLSAQDGLIWLYYLIQTELADVDLYFILEKDTPENVAKAESWPMDGLTSNARNGLCALLRRSEDADEPGQPMPDGSLGGTCGICDTDLSVVHGRLIYTITPCSPGCGGHGRIDLGSATPTRAKKMQDAVSRFEENWLLPYTWAVKHEYIDNGGYEEWTPEDEE